MVIRDDGRVMDEGLGGVNQQGFCIFNPVEAV